MLSPADSVIVFILGLLIIVVIFFAVMSVNNARSRPRTTSGTRPQSGAENSVDQGTAANRLDPSGSTPEGTDPRGADIGGTYS